MASTRVALVALLLGVGAGSSLAQPAHVQTTGAGRVTVTAVEVPVGVLLRELAALTDASIRIDPAVERRVVTLEVVDVSIRRAFVEVLRASDTNYVAVALAGAGETAIRIVVGDQRAARAVSPGASEADHDADRNAALSGASPDREEAAGYIDVFAPGGSVAGSVDGGAGAVTAQEFLAALSSPTGGRVERRGLVMAPFADEQGRPVVVDVGTAPRSHAMLPFTDDSGRPLVVPSVVAPGAPVMLPFADASGAPVLVPVPLAAPMVAPRQK